MSSGVLTVLAAALSLHILVRLPLGNLNRPGPGLLPAASSGLLFLLSGSVLVRAFVRRGPGSEAAAWSKRTRDVGLAILALVAYASLLEYVGYLVSTLLLAIFVLRALQHARWTEALLFSGGVVIVSYLIFTLLGLRLPSGPLPP